MYLTNKEIDKVLNLVIKLEKVCLSTNYSRSVFAKKVKECNHSLSKLSDNDNCDMRRLIDDTQVAFADLINDAFPITKLVMMEKVLTSFKNGGCY